MIAVAVPRVELYESDDQRWSCEDQGKYSKICNTEDLPALVSCKQWVTGAREIKWECSPAENRHWVLRHIHSCKSQKALVNLGYKNCPKDSCSLHTIATPKGEISPYFVVMFILFVIIMTAIMSTCDCGDGYCCGDAFCSGYIAGVNTASYEDDNDWGGSSWS